MAAAPPKPSPSPSTPKPTGTVTKISTALKPKKAQATSESPKPSDPPAAAPPPAACSPAQRRLFAPLGSPQRIPNDSTLLQTLPALLAKLLLEKNLPREPTIFTITISDNGTVSLTAPKDYAADYYAPYYDQLAKAT